MKTQCPAFENRHCEDCAVMWCFIKMPDGSYGKPGREPGWNFDAHVLEWESHMENLYLEAAERANDSMLGGPYTDYWEPEPDPNPIDEFEDTEYWCDHTHFFNRYKSCSWCPHQTKCEAYSPSWDFLREYLMPYLTHKS